MHRGGQRGTRERERERRREWFILLLLLVPSAVPSLLSLTLSLCLCLCLSLAVQDAALRIVKEAFDKHVRCCAAGLPEPLQPRIRALFSLSFPLSLRLSHTQRRWLVLNGLDLLDEGHLNVRQEGVRPRLPERRCALCLSVCLPACLPTWPAACLSLCLSPSPWHCCRLCCRPGVLPCPGSRRSRGAASDCA